MKISVLLNDRTYMEYIYDLITDKTLSLENFIHHKNTTRLRHSLYVSYLNYRICRLLRLDSRSAARAGLLHDYYFYENNNYCKNNNQSHLRTHPETALANASSEFELNDTETDIILKHMWPVTPQFPLYAESIVIVIVDKICAVSERLRFIKKNSRL